MIDRLSEWFVLALCALIWLALFTVAMLIAAVCWPFMKRPAVPALKSHWQKRFAHWG